MARQAAIQLVAPPTEIERLYEAATSAEHAERKAARAVEAAEERLALAQGTLSEARQAAMNAWDAYIALKREKAAS